MDVGFRVLSCLAKCSNYALASECLMTALCSWVPCTVACWDLSLLPWGLKLQHKQDGGGGSMICQGKSVLEEWGCSMEAWGQLSCQEPVWHLPLLIMASGSTGWEKYLNSSSLALEASRWGSV